MNSPFSPRQIGVYPTSGARRPIPKEVVSALDDLAQVVKSLPEYFDCPVDRAVLSSAESLLRQLAELHRPTAIDEPSCPVDPPARSVVAPLETVEDLRDLVKVLSILLLEFYDPSDKAAVRDAMQRLLDVALVHDRLGGYGVYPAIDAEDPDAEGQP